ncbi:hypothetical protein ZIOFF_062389 [Zingiber officinale]|uniref:K Homology domain-containing protein n=1 Tax=Zingiber officinale TaxID=94328 RepID=A0A8J5F116_ZINOF|nr:hypothetical protein ZIOFF_062389 [Zingiber officinale]
MLEAQIKDEEGVFALKEEGKEGLYRLGAAGGFLRERADGGATPPDVRASDDKASSSLVSMDEVSCGREFMIGFWWFNCSLAMGFDLSLSGKDLGKLVLGCGVHVLALTLASPLLDSFLCNVVHYLELDSWMCFVTRDEILGFLLFLLEYSELGHALSKQIDVVFILLGLVRHARVRCYLGLTEMSFGCWLPLAKMILEYELYFRCPKLIDMRFGMLLRPSTIHTPKSSLPKATTDQMTSLPILDSASLLHVSYLMDELVEHTVEEETSGDVGNSHDMKQEQDMQIEAESGEKRWPGWPGESVFRILIPSNKVGSLIGRKGEFIKKMCEESKARIKILDGPPGAPERTVMISAKEEPDASVSPAMDGLLRVHKRIIDGLDGESGLAPSAAGNTLPTRLLVAATQAGSLIGKHGATIKSIQESCSSIVRVVELLFAKLSWIYADNLPPVALPDDRVVEIQGEPIGMHKAVELIAAHLRKFLVDRSVLPLFEKRPLPNMHMEQNMPPPQPWGHSQGLPPGAGSAYGGNPQFMSSRPHDSFYPPDLPPLEKQPHHGISMYGQNAPTAGVHSGANQQPQSMISQITQHMQILLSYADAVIGEAGSNISYIRRASGATITIQETRGVPGEMTVEISGTATQVQTAQQLIQA